MPEPNTATQKDTENPVVTVVIPCHNHADMIGSAIDSVTMQEYRPIQIIVVDDGSTDNPEKIIQQKLHCFGWEHHQILLQLYVFYFQMSLLT